VRVGLLVTDRPITPLERGAPRLKSGVSGAPATEGGLHVRWIQVRPETPVLPKLLWTNLSAVDLNNIIGGRGTSSAGRHRPHHVVHGDPRRGATPG